MKVRTNADTPADAKKARELGAEGIGLCRTEHMFFEGNRIDAFREMICAETVDVYKRQDEYPCQRWSLWMYEQLQKIRRQFPGVLP